MASSSGFAGWQLIAAMLTLVFGKVLASVLTGVELLTLGEEDLAISVCRQRERPYRRFECEG